VDTWEGGLRATGGALVPAKSYWYLIDFRWQNGKWKYVTKAELPGEISIRDTCGTQRVQLERVDPKEARETLGVFLSMDGNNKEQILQLRQKAEKWSECIRAGYLDREDAWYAINTTIMKSLEYPMMTTTISKREWNFILRPVLETGLPQAGINKKIPSSSGTRATAISRTEHPTSICYSGTYSSTYNLESWITKYNHRRPYSSYARAISVRTRIRGSPSTAGLQEVSPQCNRQLDQEHMAVYYGGKNLDRRQLPYSATTKDRR
jgi:hypothetical protein